MTPPRIDRLDREQRSALAKALTPPRYELVPTSSASAAAEALSEAGTVTITASPRRGIEATVDLALELRGSGLRVVPHIAARLIRDREHLGETMRRLADSGIEEIFVIGGDGPPRGEFTDALGLIRAIVDIPQTFAIGIAGYPEGHPFISEEALFDAVAAKQEFASYLITQVSFDAAAINDWIARMRESGIRLPVLIGLPGVVAVRRLLAVSAKIGVGDSIRFLARHGGLWWRLARPNYSPTELLVSLGPAISDPGLGVAGVHLYTFNQVAATEEWRQDLLAELGARDP